MRNASQERGNQLPLPFNQVITQMIEESWAIAASDALVKDGEIGGAWIIKNNYRSCNGICRMSKFK